jgi:cellulase/cellobiase CelA1
LDVTGVALVATAPGVAPGGDDPAIPPADLATPACGVPPVVGDGPVAGHPGLDVTSREDRWNDGYCAYYTIANTTEEPIEWAVDTEVDGTINNAWNVNRSGDGGRVRFWGVEWNAFVQSNQQVEFGFCADL